MIHILNLLLAIGVFITCLCKRIDNVEPRVWALSPPLLYHMRQNVMCQVLSPKKQLLLNTLRIAGSNTHCLEYLSLPTGATLSTHSSANQVATGPPMTTAWAVGSSIVTPLNHDMEALQKTQCFTSQDLCTAVYLWLLNDVAPKKRRQRITSLGQSKWATRTDVLRGLEAGRAPKSINNFGRVERPTQIWAFQNQMKYTIGNNATETKQYKQHRKNKEQNLSVEISAVYQKNITKH